MAGWADRLAALEEFTPSFAPHAFLKDVEFVQSTQFFGHHPSGINRRVLVDGHARHDNTIPLYEGKPTLVRAYFDVFGKFTGRIKAYLRIVGRSKRYYPVGPVQQIEWTAPDPTFEPSRAIGNYQGNLNFLLPWELCFEEHELEIVYWYDSDPELWRFYEPGAHVTHQWSRTERIEFQPSAMPSLRGVMIEITGDPAAPPVTGSQGWLDAIMPTIPVLPISGYHFVPCVSLSQPATIHAQNGTFTILDVEWWSSLLTAMEGLKSASEPVDIHIGVVPTSATWPQLSGNGAAAAGITDFISHIRMVTLAGYPRETVHEIGHIYGLDHAPAPKYCPDQSGIGDYPEYQPYGVGSIGEYGFDTSRLRQFDPTSCTDIMTSCETVVPIKDRSLQTVWISPYNYMRIADALYPQRDFELRPWMPKVKSAVISFTTDQNGGGGVELASWHVLEGARQSSPRSGPTLALRAIDARGATLARGWAGALDPCCACGEWIGRLFHGVCPLPAGTVAVEVEQDRRPLLRLDPEFDALSPALEVGIRGARRNVARLKWSCKGADRALIRYSSNGGLSWTAIHAAPGQGSKVFDLDNLPGGEDCLFELAVASGLRTGSAVSRPFALPRKPRGITLMGEGGEPAVCLQAGFWSPDFGIAPPLETRWSIVGGEEIGCGNQIYPTDLEPGRHKLLLEAPDGLEGVASARLLVEVEEREGHKLARATLVKGRG